MHICKTNSPKSREIYHLCFLVPVQTERSALCNLAESSSTLRSKRGLLNLKKGASIRSRNWSDLPRSTQLLEARVSAVERDSKGDQYRVAFFAFCPTMMRPTSGVFG